MTSPLKSKRKALCAITSNAQRKRQRPSSNTQYDQAGQDENALPASLRDDLLRPGVPVSILESSREEISATSRALIQSTQQDSWSEDIRLSPHPGRRQPRLLPALVLSSTSGQDLQQMPECLRTKADPGEGMSDLGTGAICGRVSLTGERLVWNTSSKAASNWADNTVSLPIPTPVWRSGFASPVERFTLSSHTMRDPPSTPNAISGATQSQLVPRISQSSSAFSASMETSMLRRSVSDVDMVVLAPVRASIALSPSFVDPRGPLMVDPDENMVYLSDYMTSLRTMTGTKLEAAAFHVYKWFRQAVAAQEDFIVQWQRFINDPDNGSWRKLATVQSLSTSTGETGGIFYIDPAAISQAEAAAEVRQRYRSAMTQGVSTGAADARYPAWCSEPFFDFCIDAFIPMNLTASSDAMQKFASSRCGITPLEVLARCVRTMIRRIARIRYVTGQQRSRYVVTSDIKAVFNNQANPCILTESERMFAQRELRFVEDEFGLWWKDGTRMVEVVDAARLQGLPRDRTPPLSEAAQDDDQGVYADDDASSPPATPTPVRTMPTVVARAASLTS